MVCGYFEASPPPGCGLIQVKTAQEMRAKILVENCDIFIGTAAVADYRVKDICGKKIKSNHDTLNLTLIKNPDILAEVSLLENKSFTVGFALETENLIENARKKLQTKQLDMIIANLCRPDIAFGSEDNEVFILSKRTKAIAHLKKSSKYEIAYKIVNSLYDIAENN